MSLPETASHDEPFSKGTQTFWDRALLVLVLLWTFLLGCTQMRSTDIWFHIRTGQLILERGHVPWIDWYTYTDGDQPWVDLHWLFQILTANLYGWGGVPLLVLVKAGCLAVTVAIGWVASGPAVPSWGKTLLWALPIICLSGRALVRPEMLTLIFLAIWLWVLFGLQERPERIWWLPAVQLIWTNCHGLFVLGLVVGGAYLMDRVWRAATGNRWGTGRNAYTLSSRRLVVPVAITMLASLVNPYFEEGALYPFVLFGELSDLGPTENESLLYFIRQLGWANVFLLAEIGVWLTTAGSFLWLATYRRFDIMRLLLFAGFSYLSWRALRNVNIFALVAGIVCCLNAADVRRLRAASRMEQLSESLFARLIRWMTRTTGRWLPNPATQLVLVLLTVWCPLIVTNRWHAWNNGGFTFGIGEPDSYFIHDAARFAGQEGFPQTAFIAQFGQAAVYVFHNAPRNRVYLDGRLDVISPETGRQYFQILDLMATGNRVWENAVRDSAGNLPVVILDSRHARPLINGLYSNSRWRMVFADESAAVFLEVALADRLNLRPADPTPLFEPPD